MFELSVFYFQEKNDIVERKNRILIERMRYTIIGGKISNNLWPEILLAITHILNLLPTSSFKSQSSFKSSFNCFLYLKQLCILAQELIFLYTKKNKRLNQLNGHFKKNLKFL